MLEKNNKIMLGNYKKTHTYTGGENLPRSKWDESLINHPNPLSAQRFPIFFSPRRHQHQRGRARPAAPKKTEKREKMPRVRNYRRKVRIYRSLEESAERVSLSLSLSSLLTDDRWRPFFRPMPVFFAFAFSLSLLRRRRWQSLFSLSLRTHRSSHFRHYPLRFSLSLP